MQKSLLSLCLFLAITLNITAQEESQMDNVSYSLGVLMGQNLKAQGFEGLDIDEMVKAMNEVLDGKTPLVDPQTANTVVQKYLQEKQASQFAAVKSEGEDFLAENGKKSGVTTTASGLQYEVINAGSGSKPTSSDKVKVHYHGTLLSGKVFDSSVERDSPATFGVTQVIQGWVEGLQLMPVGAKYRFYIPQHLAYGQRGAPPRYHAAFFTLCLFIL